LNRRELFTLGLKRSRSLELSCERLYMQYCDANLENTTSELFERLEVELRGIHDLRLVDTAFLASQDFRKYLDPVLESVRARGGRITHGH
jgi:hypothetical protein